MKQQTTKLGPFTAGINQVASETEIPNEALREATNVDITRQGAVRRRAGYTKLKTLTNSHSLYSGGSQTLLVSGGYLQRLLEDHSTLSQLVAVSGEVSYAPINGMIYWTDGTTLGRITSSGEAVNSWVPNPTGQPTLTATTTGSFQPGNYQVAVTFVDADRMESGTDQAAVVTLDVTGSIHLTDIPQSTDASYVRVYITTANGTELQRHVDINMGTTEFYVSTPFFGKALETQFAEPMIAGDLLCHHYGRLYAASGNTLVYSESLRPGLTRLMDNYFTFASAIKIVLSHTTGLYVVTDKTYFLPGGDPEKMPIQVSYPHSAVPGTGQLVTASQFNIEQEGEVPYWFSDNGPVLGLTSGNVVPLTEKNISPPTYASGATLFREEDGIRSMITALQAPGDTAKFGATDSVSFEVRRNGITVPA